MIYFEMVFNFKQVKILNTILLSISA